MENSGMHEELKRAISSHDVYHMNQLLSEDQSLISPSDCNCSSPEKDIRFLNLLRFAYKRDSADCLALILLTWYKSQPLRSDPSIDDIRYSYGMTQKNEESLVKSILRAFYPEEVKRLEYESLRSKDPGGAIKKKFLYYTEYLPYIFFIVSLVIAAIMSIIYFYSDLSQSQAIHVSSFVGQLSAWVSFYLVTTTEPGYISQHNLLSAHLDSYITLLSDFKSALEKKVIRDSKIYCCHNCRQHRPLRAGHSIVSQKCIRVYDHFCTFLYKDIGRGNYIYFYLYLVTMSVVSMPQFLRLSALYLRHHQHAVDYNSSMILLACKTFTAWTFLMWLFIGYLLCAHSYLCYTGKTSREWKYGPKTFPYLLDRKLMLKAKTQDIYLKDYI